MPERVPIEAWSKNAVMLPDGDHAVTPFTSGDDPEPRGALVWHRRPDGDWCGGFIQWRRDPDRPEGPLWTLHSLEPLHVEPSIRCSCSDDGMSHGWIRGGAWEPANPMPDWVGDLT